MIVLSIDLSQVESRVELMLAAATARVVGTDVAKECVRLATAHPSEFDIHTWSASVVLDKSECDITDIERGDGQPSDRHIGKLSLYLFQRGGGAQTMADALMAKGYVVTPETCARRLARLAARLPAIPEGYFPDIRQQVMRYRGLGTTWGAIWRCDWQRLDEELYGVAYSYPPVRDTMDLVNQHGFLPLSNAIRLRQLNPHPRRPSPRLHVHGHDSLVASVHPDDAYDVAAFVERTLGRAVRYYAAGSLCVPVTYQLGETWEGRFKYKRLPDRKPFTDAAWECERHAMPYRELEAPRVVVAG